MNKCNDAISMLLAESRNGTWSYHKLCNAISLAPSLSPEDRKKVDDLLETGRTSGFVTSTVEAIILLRRIMVSTSTTASDLIARIQRGAVDKKVENEPWVVDTIRYLREVGQQ